MHTIERQGAGKTFDGGMARKQKKAARDACEEEWRQIKVQAVEAWKAECQKLKLNLETYQ